MPKIITIGSATMDVFVEADEASVVSVASKNKNADFMSYPYGTKIDISKFSSNVGGGGVNTACNFANLGFETSVIFKIGASKLTILVLPPPHETNVNKVALAIIVPTNFFINNILSFCSFT